MPWAIWCPFLCGAPSADANRTYFHRRAVEAGAVWWHHHRHLAATFVSLNLHRRLWLRLCCYCGPEHLPANCLTICGDVARVTLLDSTERHQEEASVEGRRHATRHLRLTAAVTITTCTNTCTTTGSTDIRSVASNFFPAAVRTTASFCSPARGSIQPPSPLLLPPPPPLLPTLVNMTKRRRLQCSRRKTCHSLIQTHVLCCSCFGRGRRRFNPGGVCIGVQLHRRIESGSPFFSLSLSTQWRKNGLFSFFLFLFSPSSIDQMRKGEETGASPLLSPSGSSLLWQQMTYTKTRGDERRERCSGEWIVSFSQPVHRWQRRVCRA